MEDDLPASSDRQSRWRPSPFEAIAYVALALMAGAAVASGYVFVMHKNAMLALYSGGAPATDTIFCTLPVAAILGAIAAGTYIIRHVRIPQSPESAAAVKEYFSEEER